MSWIKVDHVTPDKPEVHQIAEQLGIDPDAVCGKLLRVWIWADQQTLDGNAPSVTRALLDRVTFVTGFADALVDVGWLSDDGGELVFPNFDRHNGETAKKRALTNRRVSRVREVKRSCNAPSVTDCAQKALPDKSKSKNNSISEGPTIPERLNTPEVKAAFDDWQQHLLDEGQEQKRVRVGSPQESVFWQQQLKRGPDGFVAAVRYTISNRWLNLRDPPEPQSRGHGQPQQEVGAKRKAALAALTEQGK